MSDEKKGLPRPPLYTSDYITIAEVLDFDLERFGKLVLSLMYYTADGTVPDDLPPDLKAMFSIYQRRISAAYEKYEQKCLNNAKNGAKGGKAKAAKTQKPTKFIPPTLKQFRDAVVYFYDNDELGDRDEMPDDTSIKRLYTQLKEDNWQIEGEPIQIAFDWEMLILSRFAISSFLPFSDEPYIRYIFGKYHGLRDADGKTQADGVSCDFCEDYNAKLDGWTVGGEFYPKAKWQEALDKYIPIWQKRNLSE